MNKIPTHSDKTYIQSNIKKLNKIDHIHIYNILKTLSSSSYHMNESNIYFDLNSIPVQEFWLIYDHVKFSVECLTRNRVIEQSKIEHANILSKKMG
jgi:hypothetical protein